MSCLKTHLIHEATICCDVKWFTKNCKFLNSFAGEGQSLINVKDNIEESNIYKCMVCLCHKFNTVNKSKWNTNNNQEKFSNLRNQIQEHLKILSNINL